MDHEVAALFAKVTRASFFRELAPHLHVDEGCQLEALALDDASAADARVTLERHGYFSLPKLVARARVDALAETVRALHELRIPTTFLYAYDEVWRLGFALARALEGVVGARYAVAPDVWAWFIPPVANQRGWRPHRGTYTLERRPNGMPRVINVWLALGDVTVDTACMHVVPLDRDPHFPDELKRVDFDASAIVALPGERGTLLGWSSNVLHFGGEMSARATTPRISLSFTLRDPREPGDLDTAPTFQERIDMVAEMIAIYERNEGAALDAAREWAKLHLTMRALGSRHR
jgi:hypothetical protein